MSRVTPFSSSRKAEAIFLKRQGCNFVRTPVSVKKSNASLHLCALAATPTSPTPPNASPHRGAPTLPCMRYCTSLQRESVNAPSPSAAHYGPACLHFCPPSKSNSLHLPIVIKGTRQSQQVLRVCEEIFIAASLKMMETNCGAIVCKPSTGGGY